MTMRSHDIEIINPDPLASELAQGLDDLKKGTIIRRIWDRDGTVWKPEDREIQNRLGWLAAPEESVREISDMEAFAASVRGEGLIQAIVLGMGGSSLAAEVFARSFETAAGGLELEIFDTTEPGTVARAATRLDIRKTLFIVSSKSGTTAELLALLSFFYDRARKELGANLAGTRFAAVTDPRTPLETLASSLHFRRVFHGQPAIGGRFSALSAFGLVPAALKGIDLSRLLSSAQAMAGECHLESPADNPGAYLGTILGTAAVKGRDKLTLFVSPRLRPLAGWLEQMIAESTGKEGQGIVPIIEDGAGLIDGHGKDRLFIELATPGGSTSNSGLRELVNRGAPLLRLTLADPYSLAGHFFLWEFATAVAAHFMAINPFDQPDVEATKKKTRDVLSGAGSGPRSFSESPTLVAKGLRFISSGQANSPSEALTTFLGSGGEGDYVAILAYLPRTGAVERLLSGLSVSLRLHTRLPVTVGFGPRYLHSTGQLHKGDGNRGLFLMLMPAVLPKVEIPAVPGIARPTENFADLFKAQARGDGMALAEKGRRLLTIELSSPIEAGLEELASLLG